MIAPYRGVVIQPLVYRYFSPQSSVKFFSLLNLRIILRPGVQANRRQSSRLLCCSTVNRDVIICPKDKSRVAVTENLLRWRMAADYDNILKIRNFVIYPRPDQLVYRIFFSALVSENSSRPACTSQYSWPFIVSFPYGRNDSMYSTICRRSSIGSFRKS